MEKSKTEFNLEDKPKSLSQTKSSQINYLSQINNLNLKTVSAESLRSSAQEVIQFSTVIRAVEYHCLDVHDVIPKLIQIILIIQMAMSLILLSHPKVLGILQKNPPQHL